MELDRRRAARTGWLLVTYPLHPSRAALRPWPVCMLKLRRKRAGAAAAGVVPVAEAAGQIARPQLTRGTVEPGYRQTARSNKPSNASFPSRARQLYTSGGPQPSLRPRPRACPHVHAGVVRAHTYLQRIVLTWFSRLPRAPGLRARAMTHAWSFFRVGGRGGEGEGAREWVRRAAEATTSKRSKLSLSLSLFPCVVRPCPDRSGRPSR